MHSESFHPPLFEQPPTHHADERVRFITAELERMDAEDTEEPIPFSGVVSRITHKLQEIDRLQNDGKMMYSTPDLVDRYSDIYASERKDEVEQREKHREDLLLRRMNIEERPAIADCKTIEDLTVHIAERPLFVRTNTKQCDYAEHLAKRVDMAWNLENVELAPPSFGLKEKTEDLIRRKKEQPISYVEYLIDRHPELRFQDEELQRILEKIPPEAFATIDIRVEKTILMLNALENTTTAYSCAGHADQQHRSPRYRQNYREAYIALRSEDRQLLSALEKVAHSQREQVVTIEKDALLDGKSAPENYIIRFRQYPDTDWLVQNNRLSPLALCEKSQALLDEYFGKHLPPIHFNGSMNQYFAQLENRRQTLQQEAITHSELAPLLKQSPHELYRETDKLMPYYLFNKEYADYYSSERARDRSDLFLQWIASLAEARRKE